jgi:hypothetical protein
MKKVTDESLIQNLNKSTEIRKAMMPQAQGQNQPGGQEQEVTKAQHPLQTFLSSAMNAGPEALGNLGVKSGAISQDTMNQFMPEDEDDKQGRESNPISHVLGSIAGFLPVGAWASMGLRTLPMAGKLIKAAAPSMLKRMGVHGLEGAGIGALFSPPGKEGEDAGLGALIGSLLGGPGAAIAKSLPGLKQRFSNVANVEELGAQRGAAKGANEEQDAIIEALKKQYAEQPGGASNPEAMARQINERMGKINELEPETRIPYENTENRLGPPGGEEYIPNAMREKEMGLREAEHYLGKNSRIDTEFAAEVKDSIKKAKQHIQKEYYEPTEKYAENNYVEIPKVGAVLKIEDNFIQLGKSKIFKNEPGFEQIKKSIEKQEKNKGRDLVPASDFIRQWKETKQAASKAHRLGWKEGGENQAYWQDQELNLRKLADDQLEILRQNLPEEYYNKLVTATKLWREEIAPFYGNKIYEQAKGLERIDVPNIMEEVRGKGRGQEKMKELILANPNLTRQAIGHTYAKNPEKLLQASEYEKDFINQLPALKGMMERLKGHNLNIEIAKAQHAASQANVSRANEGHKEMVKSQMKRQEAITQTNKLNQEVETLHERRARLIKELDRKEITQKEFEAKDKQYSDAINDKKATLRKLKKGAVVAAGAIGAGALGADQYISRIMK